MRHTKPLRNGTRRGANDVHRLAMNLCAIGVAQVLDRSGRGYSGPRCGVPAGPAARCERDG